MSSALGSTIVRGNIRVCGRHSDFTSSATPAVESSLKRARSQHPSSLARESYITDANAIDKGRCRALRVMSAAIRELNKPQPTVPREVRPIVEEHREELSPTRHAPYKPLVAEYHHPLSLPPLLQRSHQLVSARMPSRDRPLVNSDWSRFLSLELDLQVLHSPVFHDLLAQRRLLLRV